MTEANITEHYFPEGEKSEETKIQNWDFIHLENSEIRIYYRLNEGELNGFNFYVLLWTSNDASQEDLWQGFDAECLFYGTAYYDGIRHLYMGLPNTEYQGYIHYPYTQNMIELFTALNKLELEYCHDVIVDDN